MERQNFNLGYAMWEDFAKPIGQAAMVGSALYMLGYKVTNQTEGGIVWGLVGGTAVIIKKVFIEGLSGNRIYAPQETNQLEDTVEVPELKPWEVETERQVTDTTLIYAENSNKYYSTGIYYTLPIQEEKFQRAAFHIRYLKGRFSHNYLTSPKRSPKIMTKTNLTDLEHYLVERKAAKWKSIYDKRGGVELLPDALELINYYSKKYRPLPHERLLLASICREGVRTQNTYTQHSDTDADFEENTDYEEGED